MMPLRSALFTAIVFLAAPAGAQQTALFANVARNGNPDTMTCRGMMDVAAMTTASARKKAAARREIHLARAEMRGGRETSCKSHMKLALQALN